LSLSVNKSVKTNQPIDGTFLHGRAAEDKYVDGIGQRAKDANEQANIAVDLVVQTEG
jgi:hypothetical protein